MPIAQFVQPTKNQSRSIRMFPPKKITQLEHWLKAARKRIPEIPDAPDGTWHILHQDVSVQYIKFTFESTNGEKCYLVIDRMAPSIG